MSLSNTSRALPSPQISSVGSSTLAPQISKYAPSWKWFVAILLGIAVILIVASIMCITPTTRRRQVLYHQPLHDAMRRAWTDHVIWTRLYLIARVSKQPSQSNVAAQRLMSNQEDIGALFGSSLKSNRIKETVATLLKEHIHIATRIVDAVLAHDVVAEQTQKQQWDRNAHEIAVALSSLGPAFGSVHANYKMLKQHLELTAHELVYLIQENYSMDANNWDVILTQALQMADHMSSALILPSSHQQK